jgi:poly(beta-D-mannuronate) lyase
MNLLRRRTVRRLSTLSFWFVALGVVISSGSASWSKNALCAKDHVIADATELTAVLKIAQPGDNLIMRNGQWKDADLRFVAKGTQEQPITLRAQAPGGAILSGSSQLRIAGEYLIVDGLWFKGVNIDSGDIVAFRNRSTELANHCRITNCAITDCVPRNKRADTKWISLYGKDNRIDHCSIWGKVNAGATVVVWISDQPNNHRIDHNYFGPRPPLGTNGGETLRVGTSEYSMNVSKTVVESNRFEQCDGEIEIISSKSCENSYLRNVFVKCKGTLTLRHGDRCIVANNYFLGDSEGSTGGVRIIGEDHRVYNNYFADLRGTGARAALSMMNGIPNSPLNGYFQAQRAVVAHNTFVNCRVNFVIGLGDGGAVLPPKDCWIINNLVSGTTAPLVAEVSIPINLRWQSNLFHGAGLGIDQRAGIKQADPKLAVRGDDIWRPAMDSPARGQAVRDVIAINTDIDGNPRGASPDIGCAEFSSGDQHSGPIQATEVGVTWPIPSEIILRS